MNQILLVDDDELLTSSLKSYLENFEFKVSAVNNGDECFSAVKDAKFDLVVLDYMLSDAFDGLQVCQSLKQKHPEMPILMLSARAEATDKIIGLEMGADDYVGKPFEPRELVARLKALLRRQKSVSKIKNVQQLFFGDLEIDLYTKVAKLSNQDLSLTSAEFALLEAFIAFPGKVFHRDELCKALKGIDWESSDRSLDILVSKLRQKLKEDLKNPRFIKTVWGSGYMFIGKENE